MDGRKDGLDLRVLNDLGMADEGTEEESRLIVVSIDGRKPQFIEPIHYEVQLSVFGFGAKYAMGEIDGRPSGMKVACFLRGEQCRGNVIVDLVDKVLHDRDSRCVRIEHGYWGFDHEELLDGATAEFELACRGEGEETASGESSDADGTFRLLRGD